MGTPKKHNWVLKILYPFIWFFAMILMTLLGPLRWRGTRNIPRKGPLLILANHLADIDPIAIQASCPRLIHYMAKAPLFRMPVLGSLIRFFSTFPVETNQSDTKSIKHSVSLLKMGEVVCIFPEGRLSDTGDLFPILPGSALIARLGQCQVICCGITGSNRVMPYGKFIPRPAFHWVTVKYGKPRSVDKSTDADELLAWIESELRALTNQ